MARKTDNQKLRDSKDMPKISILTDPRAIARYGGEKMLIAAPLDYDGLMKKVPAGKVTTTDRLRDILAEKHGADFTCPLTCGIFVNICARASVERGGEDETPWWRTLKKDGELNEKFPDGADAQRHYLEIEGHEIIQKGKRYFVRDYEQKLSDLK
jgi:hypothetical protein